MNRNDLLLSAKKLKQVSEKSALEYGLKKDMLAALLNDKMLKRLDISDLIGVGNEEMMKDNHANHARFLASIFIDYSSEILVDTVLWVFRAYRSRNFSSIYWAAQLNGWVEIYKSELSPECFSEVYPYYIWMQINIPAFNTLADEKPETTNSAH